MASAVLLIYIKLMSCTIICRIRT